MSDRLSIDQSNSGTPTPAAPVKKSGPPTIGKISLGPHEFTIHVLPGVLVVDGKQVDYQVDLGGRRLLLPDRCADASKTIGQAVEVLCGYVLDRTMETPSMRDGDGWKCPHCGKRYKLKGPFGRHLLERHQDRFAADACGHTGGFIF